MVCDRCIRAVEKLLDERSLSYSKVILGEAIVSSAVSEEMTAVLKNDLAQLGFEWLPDKSHQTISEIQNGVLEWHLQEKPAIKFSEWISARLHRDYGSLSRQFSASKGITIERYMILHRIERVKEHLLNDEYSLSYIAAALHFSSSQHLSALFKKETGFTPKEFKRKGRFLRISLDRVGDKT